MSALTTLGSSLTLLAQDWSDAGLLTLTDPRDISTPCVWLTVDRLDIAGLDQAGARVDMKAICVSANLGGTEVVLDELGALADAVSARVDLTGPISAVTLTLPSLNPDPMLALEIPFTLTLTESSD